ncbi:RND transporter [Sedimenticola sp.]|uniref:RND transporter n=1 Tax=Sedimenticola sp. TaxID=1940285 RepID=UPI003D10FD5F
MTWLDEFSLPLILLACLLLGLAPFTPEPHVWQKLKMLVDGTLVRPLDIFDLLLHGAPFVVLLLKLRRMRDIG